MICLVFEHLCAVHGNSHLSPRGFETAVMFINGFKIIYEEMICMKNKVVLKLWLRPIHTFLVLGEIEHEKGKRFFVVFFFPLLPHAFVPARGGYL